MTQRDPKFTGAGVLYIAVLGSHCTPDTAADYSKREPKPAALGADVVLKLLAGEVGAGSTGAFFKEASKPGTPLEEARSVEEAWVA